MDYNGQYRDSFILASAVCLHLFFTLVFFLCISYLKVVVFFFFFKHFGFNTFKIDPIFQRSFGFIFDSVLCASNSKK